MKPRIRAIVADDEPAARDAIRTLLSGDGDIVVVAECADGGSTLAAIREESPDLLFLDIQMPEMDGLAMLRQLRPDELPVVVFVTAYDRYALEAFEVHALDYLLKPFDDARFHQALARAKEQVRRGKLSDLRGQLLELLAGDRPKAGTGGEAPYLQRLAVKADGRVTVLDVRDIDWIQAEGDYVRIFAKRAQHLLRETMKQIEARMDPSRFIRIHRSTIVNLERIKELQPYFRGEFAVLLHDGTTLKLSRGFRPQLEAALGRSL